MNIEDLDPETGKRDYKGPVAPLAAAKADMQNKVFVPLVQSILIPKSRFSLDEAITYIKEHYKFKKVDIPQNTAFYRFRQFDPRYLKEKKGLTSVKTLVDKKTGIHKIIFYSESSES